MKYFIDTEFLEGTQKKLFGNTKPTIDLISIGIVSEDGREYYAISKDFNLKETWNRFELKPNEKLSGISPEYRMKTLYDSCRNKGLEYIKEYWIRDNVCKNLFNNEKYNYYSEIKTFKEFKRLINRFGKSNKQIAEDIIEFCKEIEGEGTKVIEYTLPYTKVYIGKENEYIQGTSKQIILGGRTKPEFYGYYSDYDWVVFCWLFGKMIDLPKGFPMYCRDLKQHIDEILRRPVIGGSIFGYKNIDDLKNDYNYPKQTNEHNALSDARWNKKLYEFLNTL